MKKKIQWTKWKRVLFAEYFAQGNAFYCTGYGRQFCEGVDPFIHLHL